MNKKRKHSLVALGSAAVLTVFAAGYLRTRSAAMRFADEDAGRHPSAALMDAATHAATSQVRKTAPVSQQSFEVASQASTGSSAAGQQPSAAASVAATKPAKKSTKTSVTSALVSATDTSGTTSTTQPTDSTAQTAAADRGPYRDGVYFGWGSSRHGDIQASVEIRDGRIYAATVSQCLTRYSCSWISMLPGQVVSRQSPETDVISGATQSSDAFYYAVVEALKQAK